MPAERLGPELTREERQRLVAAIKSLTLPVAGTLGFAKAEVTSGGVASGRSIRKRCEAGWCRNSSSAARCSTSTARSAAITSRPPGAQAGSQANRPPLQERSRRANEPVVAFCSIPENDHTGAG